LSITAKKVSTTASSTTTGHNHYKTVANLTTTTTSTLPQLGSKKKSSVTSKPTNLAYTYTSQMKHSSSLGHLHHHHAPMTTAAITVSQSGLTPRQQRTDLPSSTLLSQGSSSAVS